VVVYEMLKQGKQQRKTMNTCILYLAERQIFGDFQNKIPLNVKVLNEIKCNLWLRLIEFD